MIWFLVLIGWIVAFAKAVKCFVPESHRAPYGRSIDRDRGSLRISMLTWLIPVVSLIQWSLAAQDIWPLQSRLFGMCCLIIGSILEILAFRENPHFTADVQGPPEVITSGIYSVVAHPFYCGCMINVVGALLVLGQSWALLPASIYIGFLIRRIHLENKLIYG